MKGLGRIARLRRGFAAPLPLIGLLAAIGPLTLVSGSVDTAAHRAESAYRALPELPDGSSERGRAGVEQSAIDLAETLHAVPIDALGGVCPAANLAVSWDEPGTGYEFGGHVTPTGPAPTEATVAVNGIVVCVGFDYGYMGFEAQWSDDRWDVVAVPYETDDDEAHLEPQLTMPEGPKPVPVLAAPGTITGPIEGYAAYEPQRTCDPSAKVGTRSLAAALLRDYTGSRNLGIVRGCSVGGRSEHKEGRAFDWGVNVANAKEKAMADSFIESLLATDSEGNKHTLARRMGVMYVIFNRQIWSSYRVNEGWRPYSGASAHTDHVHISLSWAGALGRTSFWSGTVPPDLPVALPGAVNVASARPGAPRGTSTASAPTSHRHHSSWPDATDVTMPPDDGTDEPRWGGEHRGGRWSRHDDDSEPAVAAAPPTTVAPAPAPELEPEPAPTPPPAEHQDGEHGGDWGNGGGNGDGDWGSGGGHGDGDWGGGGGHGDGDWGGAGGHHGGGDGSSDHEDRGWRSGP